MSSSTTSSATASRLPDSFENRVKDVKLNKTLINTLVMDYLVSEGYPSAAQNFALEANIQPRADVESIQERVEIRNAMYGGDIQTAIEKINELNPQILDRDPALHFALLRLQLVELIRSCTATPNGDITPALTFATTHLAPRAPTSPEFLEDLERTMALLIFPPDNLAPPLAALLDTKLRKDVAKRVNEAILLSQGERTKSKLLELVRTRAWAEQKARDAKKDIPDRLDLGLDPEYGHQDMEGDSLMQGNADPRFANIQTDPRFRLPSRKNTHVKIDKRFAHMLRDERFSSKAKVDRYGRRLPKHSGRKELERLYRVEDEEEDEVEDEDSTVPPDEEVERELKRAGRKYDPARDGGFSESSSDESTSDEEDESAEEIDEDDVAETAEGSGEGGSVPVGELSPRLAIVNLDWDNIRATDLMAVFASFAPDPGSLLKVSVYPSEFGKERMEREETEGPPKEIFAKKVAREPEPGDSESEEDEGIEDEEEEEDRIKKSLLKEDQGEDFDSAKLRQYQLERLRYYYAVLTCSSKSVAEAIYNAIDGTEYLTTANFFDLRFIPDDMDFSNDKSRDECDRIPDGYRPNEFVTDALQHSKVKLTWDTDDKTRKEVQRRAFSGSRADMDENDLKAYLGSDSSEDDAPEPINVDSTLDTEVATDANPTSSSAEPKFSKKEAERQKMRALLGLGAEPTSHKSRVSNGPVGDMQITFSSGLSSNPKKGSVFENEPEIEETTAEKYVRKEKERKARRKEKMKAARNISAETITGETPKDTKDAEDEPKDLGFDDPFFTAPEDDRAAATALRKEQKRQKRTERAAAEAAASGQRAELELLMIDDDTTTRNGDTVSRPKVNHFDINEIVKAEKALKKKKKGKLSTREKAALEAKEKDDFKMDVADPRFGAVFERPEFAVDPSNPRFKGTEGMKALLEEGRRKRAREEGEEGTYAGGMADRKRMGKKVRSKEGNEDAGRSKEKGKKSGEEDLRKLVERVKGKVK